MPWRMSERVGSQTVRAKLRAARITAHGEARPSDASSLRMATLRPTPMAWMILRERSIAPERYRSAGEVHAAPRELRDPHLRAGRARAAAGNARTVPRRARA